MLGKFSVTITKDHCHLEVIDLFKKTQPDKENKIFTITTDVDNLGFYVAQHGRATAQNLVDYYINIIGEFFFRHQTLIPIEDIVIIPSGEEVTIIGLMKDKEGFQIIQGDFQSFIDIKLSESKFFQIGTTGITFAGKLFKEECLYNMLDEFVKNVNSDTEYVATKDYFNILNYLRTKVTPLLDLKKFASLNIDKISHSVFLRNTVLLEMLEYKKSTKDLLNRLSRIINDLNLENQLVSQYGLTEEKIDLLNEIKKKCLSGDAKISKN